jgi:hypothetical protein
LPNNLKYKQLKANQSSEIKKGNLFREKTLEFFTIEPKAYFLATATIFLSACQYSPLSQKLIKNILKTKKCWKNTRSIL